MDRIPAHPSRRLRREERTLQAMVALYCRGNHGTRGVCDQCSELLEYARKRVQHCPYQGDKPTCAKCPIHCYRADRREQVRFVMRYAGPRMSWRHPIFALFHLLDGRRAVPPRPAGRRRERVVPAGQP